MDQPIFHWFPYDTSCVDRPIVHWFPYGRNCVDQPIVHWFSLRQQLCRSTDCLPGFPYGKYCADQPIVHWFPYDNSCVDQLIVHQVFPMANVVWVNRLSTRFSLRQQLCRPTDCPLVLPKTTVVSTNRLSIGFTYHNTCVDQPTVHSDFFTNFLMPRGLFLADLEKWPPEYHTHRPSCRDKSCVIERNVH